MTTLATPTICPACLATLNPGDPVCTSCGIPVPAAKASVTATTMPSFLRPKANRMPVRVQLAISIDRTGSSGPFTQGISGLCQSLFGQLEPKVAELTVSVFSHGDLQDCGQEFLQLSSGVTPAQALADIRTIRYGGGGSAEEDHLHAVDQLLQQGNFANGRCDRGFLLLLTTDGSHPHPQGKTPEAIAEEIRRRNLVLLLVGTPDAQGGQAPGCPRLRALMQDSPEGFFIPISNAPDGAELQQVAARVAASVTRTVNQGQATVPAPAGR